jgi:4-hydroxy-4-methyl-2-oxoglutarate aldolase
MLPDRLWNSLRKFDTPTVCNVLELLDIRPRTDGYTDRRLSACFPHLPPMLGYAVTATFRSAAHPRGGDVYAGLEKQIRLLESSPGPKVVVFQDLDDPPASATFGEIMCTTYRAFGCVGLITSGAGRDLDQVQALGFPCFTTGTIASHGYCQIVELNVPVRVAGLWINPGDLLHGDRNGVATIPEDLAERVALGCVGMVDAESVVLDYLKQQGVTADGFAAARAECARRIRDLAAQLKSARPASDG